MATKEEIRGALVKAYKIAEKTGDYSDVEALESALGQVEPEERSVAQGVKRGVMDVAQGVKQLHLHATDQDAAKEYDAKVGDEIAEYEETAPEGIDWARLGGNAAAVAPVAMLPAGKKLAGRMLWGAAAGGLGAGSMFTESEDGDFAKDKALQTAIGAGAGGSLPVIIAPLAKMAGSAWIRISDKAKKLYAKFSDDTKASISHELMASVSALGRSWDELTDDIQASLLDDVAKQIDVGGTFDPAAAVRRSNIRAAGFVDDTAPTTAQVTRDPKQWTFERNTAKLDDVGDPLRDRFVNQNRKLHQNARDLEAAIGPDGTDYGAGVQAESVAQDFAEASQRQVRQAYDDAARLYGPDDLIASPSSLNTRLTEIYDERFDAILPAIRVQVEKLANGELSPSVANINRVLKIINKRSPTDPDALAALSQLRRAFTASLDETARTGGAGAEALRNASRLAAKRFNMLDDGGRRALVKSLVSGRARSDNFIKTKVIAGSIDELGHLKRFLTEFDEEFTGVPRNEGVEAWNAIRSSVIRNLNQKAGYDSAAEQGFNGKRWLDAFADLKDRRDILFTEDENALIDILASAARDLTYTPNQSAVNTSNTAPEIINRLRQISSKVPLFSDTANFMLGIAAAGKQGIQNAAKKQAAQRAAAGAYNVTRPERAAAAGQSVNRLLLLPNAPIAAGASQLPPYLLEQQ